MRHAAVITLGGFFVLSLTGWAQEAPDTQQQETVEIQGIITAPPDDALSENLEDLLALALENHPEIATARAQLQMAEAELRKAELQVIREVTNLQSELALAKTTLAQKQKIYEAGRLPLEQLAAPMREVKQLETALRFAVGHGLGSRAVTANIVPSVAPVHGYSEPPVTLVHAERESLSTENTQPETWEALRSPVELPAVDGVMLGELLDMYRELWSINVTVSKSAREIPLQYVNLTGVPLREALAAIADSTGRSPNSLVFILRDYGLYATTRQEAMTIAGAAIPEDVPLLVPAGE